MIQRPLLDIFTIIIEDAEGTRRRVPYIIRGFSAVGAFPTRPPAGVIARISKHANRGLVLLPIILSVILSLAITIGATMGLVQLFAGWPQGWLIGAVLGIMVGPILSIAVCDAAINGFVRRIYRPRYIAIALEEGRCPFCMYVIKGLPEEPDEHCRCPECAGKWRFVSATHADNASNVDKLSSRRPTA